MSDAATDWIAPYLRNVSLGGNGPGDLSAHVWVGPWPEPESRGRTLLRCRRRRRRRRRADPLTLLVPVVRSAADRTGLVPHNESAPGAAMGLHSLRVDPPSRRCEYELPSWGCRDPEAARPDDSAAPQVALGYRSTGGLAAQRSSRRPDYLRGASTRCMRRQLRRRRQAQTSRSVGARGPVRATIQSRGGRRVHHYVARTPSSAHRGSRFRR